MATVFLDGQFLEPGEARVSAFDAGFQHGVGLFETFVGGVSGGGDVWAFRLDEHLERLDDSARALGLSESLRLPALADAVLKTIEQSGLARARVRLTITGGDLNMLGRPLPGQSAGQKQAERAGAGEPTVLIVAQPATTYPREMFERGVAVTIADFKANPLDPMAGHKTLNYWPRLRELQIAASKRAAEALVFQVTNFLCGGCVSSAVLVKDGRLLTPIVRGEEEIVGRETTVAEPIPEDEPVIGGVRGHAARGPAGLAVPSPVLPGITREWVLEWANQNRVPVVRKMITIDEVLGADELLLVNSSWGVLPVVSVEAKTIKAGTVGPVGERLVKAYAEAMIDAGAEE